MEKKIAALQAYKIHKDEYHFDPGVLHAMMVQYGLMAERPFAEGFDILRIVGNFNTLKTG